MVGAAPARVAAAGERVAREVLNARFDTAASVSGAARSTGLNLSPDGFGAGAPKLAATASGSARGRAVRALREVTKTSNSITSPETTSGKRADKAIEAVHRTTGSGA